MYAKLAWRNMWRNRKRTGITVSAIVFAAVAAVFMQSLNRGSHEQMLDRTVRYHTGYLRVQDVRFEDEPSLDNAFAFDEPFRARIRQSAAHVGEILPRIETFMLAANDEAARGALVFGIDPEAEHRFNGLRDRLTHGRYLAADDAAVALMAEGLAERLGLGVGDTVALIGQGRFGMSASGLFTIAGLVAHPLQDMNRQAVYLPLGAAQHLLSADGHATAALIEPGSPRHTESLAAALRETFANEDLAVLTWRDMLPELLELFEFDLATPRFLTLVLYIVIGFGFFGTVLTMTMERMREFAMLMAIGMRRGRLAAVVALETLFMAATGVLAGLATAWALLFYFHRNPIVLTGSAAQAVKDMGWDPILPMSFAPDQFTTQGLFVFAIAFVVFLFPLVKIHRMNILESTRR